ncbi:hypothetical protein [Fulvivirga sedimenti]|uniref:VWA domain-containing protein n=1 Tax=Fulvivirga sedimenti TaxID=2879465 RepID=A0A9X1HLW4_9BACT|nr:hypothetical protein [Fulvivirga sedimenti]MCA6074286.1 hypothetical protein [Fulvivirga sedimenti]
MGSSVQLAYPVEFILLCIAAGFVYAYLLYKRSAPWSMAINRMLFGLRWITVTILAVLLLAPVLRQIQNYTEKPTVVLAVDNSSSIRALYDSAALRSIYEQVKTLADQLADQDYVVQFATLNGMQDNPDSIVFSQEKSNLDIMMRDIRNDYEGKNLQEVILLSDGIYNEGVSPAYRTFPFQVTTVGLGDSTAKKDIRIESLTYNKIAYEGNKFPLVVSLHQNGYDGTRVQVTVFNKGSNVASENILFDDGMALKDVNILLDAGEKGIQRYVVQVSELPDEFISENNRADAYVEIIEGKQKVCLVAATPHPDLSAIVESLQSNSNYEVELFIMSIADDRDAFLRRNEPTDLFILHQLPSRRYPMNWSEKLAGGSVLYVYGPQTDLDALSSLNDYFQIQTYAGEFDQVTGVINPSYLPFTYSDDFLQMLSQFPPLVTPFGEINLNGEAQVMMYQKVGSIETGKPLVMTMERDEIKSGIIIGSGMWQWKLTDYAKNKDNTNFNEFVQKLVQYLSTRADKRRFRLFPLKESYTEGEDVIFDTEVYNELYERVFGNRINLTIRESNGEEQTYSYVTSEGNSRYTVAGLKEGVYSYFASTDLEGSTERVSGEFVVQKLNLESMRLTADFNLLRQISEKNGGEFYLWDEIENLKNDLDSKEAQGIIFSEEKYLSAINLTWIFLLIVLLISVEWVVRKYYGSY